MRCMHRRVWHHRNISCTPLCSCNYPVQLSGTESSPGLFAHMHRSRLSQPTLSGRNKEHSRTKVCFSYCYWNGFVFTESNGLVLLVGLMSGLLVKGLAASPIEGITPCVALSVTLLAASTAACIGGAVGCCSWLFFQ